MIRVATASFCAIAGTVAGGLALSALSVVGFDDEAQTEAFPVSEGAYAVVLNEATVPFADSTATLTVTGEDPLFLGTANGVDAESYLTGVAHDEITAVSFPGEPVHRMVAGEETPVVPAESRDWWTSTEEGTSVSKTFDLEADPEIIIVAPQEGGSLAGAEVTVSMRAEGIAGLALLGLAFAVIMFGIAGFFVLQWWQSRIRIRPKRPGARRGGQQADRPRSQARAVPGGTAEAGSSAAADGASGVGSGSTRGAVGAAEAPVAPAALQTPAAENPQTAPHDEVPTAPSADEPASAPMPAADENTAEAPRPTPATPAAAPAVDDEPEYDGPPRTRRERREREARERARKERGL